MHASPPLSRDTLHAIVRIVLLYALFAALWILLSDYAVAWLFPGPASIQIASTLKGLLFVAVTAILLFLLILRFAARQGNLADAVEPAKVGAGGTASQWRGQVAWSIALLTLAFGTLGAMGLQQSWNFNRQQQHEQMQAVARLKVQLLESWLAERHRDAELARSAPSFREGLPQWRATGEARHRQRVEQRLGDLRRTLGYRNAAIVDADARLLVQTGTMWHEETQLNDTVRRAIALDRTLMTGFYRAEEPAPHVHLDFVAPIPGTDAAVVLRVDVETALYPALSLWPLPSESAEVQLFRRDGDALVFLNELRHQPGAALAKRIPLDAPAILSVKALAENYAPGALLEGIDYRGRPALGAALPVANTDWWVIAKVDRDEVLAEARRDALWVMISGLMTWLVAVVLAVLFFQRRDLLLTQQAAAEKEEKLHALQLLKAISENSPDAIFAKNTDGRYTLFNPAACAFVGKTEDEVLGRDLSTLFPSTEAAEVDSNDRKVMAEKRQDTYEETLTTPLGVRTFHATKGPLCDEQGNVTGMYGISRDITERVQAEIELRERAAELERFNRAMVGRELDMLRLKREINALNAELGRPVPHALYAVDDKGADA